MAVSKLIFFALATFLLEVTCQPNADRHADVGIIGGHQILIEKAPYMASLRLNGTFHWCGASIIHEQYILTAAHCIVPNRQYKVLVGTDNVDGLGELFEIEEINVHERYNAATHNNDVCLIKLKKPMTFGPKVGKIELANPTFRLHNGVLLNTTGWGSTDGNLVVSPKLLQVSVPLTPKRECKLLYATRGYIITTHMICAGDQGHDSCQGDSGGPLTLGDLQVGITSFGLGCGKTPGVYARVASLYPWITRKMHVYL